MGLPPTPIHVVEQVGLKITQHAPEALDDPRLQRERVVDIDPALQAKFSLQLGETAAISCGPLGERNTHTWLFTH